MSQAFAIEAAAPRALSGRVVLVVGAHGALGHASALACADAGATVVLLGRKVPKLNRVHDAIVRAGGEALLYPLDLEGATPDDYAEMAERIGDGLGRLDGVLHCAAHFGGLTPLENTDPADFARSIHVNLTARWWLTQACLPLMRSAEDASVVFAIDGAAGQGGAYWGAYGVAQSALAALVGTLHAELANSPVRVAGLAPGPMRTTLRSKAFVEDAEPQARAAAEVAPACVHLLSAAGIDRRGQVWAPFSI
ncbi:SDR family NAD(P)-dependent oxidoreductase [Lysobacter brunescens]|uniref:SDR family NAD(P)-dependent oxidoreductase n=1 Tax=Lysobacter brunescens TaxID=262323 RepID=A0ABW2YLA7_9GAMM